MITSLDFTFQVLGNNHQIETHPGVHGIKNLPAYFIHGIRPPRIRSSLAVHHSIRVACLRRLENVSKPSLFVPRKSRHAVIWIRRFPILHRFDIVELHVDSVRGDVQISIPYKIHPFFSQLRQPFQNRIIPPPPSFSRFRSAPVIRRIRRENDQSVRVLVVAELTLYHSPRPLFFSFIFVRKT